MGLVRELPAGDAMIAPLWLAYVFIYKGPRQ